MRAAPNLTTVYVQPSYAVCVVAGFIKHTVQATALLPQLIDLRLGEKNACENLGTICGTSKLLSYPRRHLTVFLLHKLSQMNMRISYVVAIPRQLKIECWHYLLAATTR